MHGRLVHIRAPVLLPGRRDAVFAPARVFLAAFFGHHRDHGSRVAVLRVHPAAQHGQFLHRAGVDPLKAREPGARVVVHHAHPIDHVRGFPEVAPAHALFFIGRHACLQLHKIRHFAHDRQRLDFFRRDDRLALGLVVLHRRTLRNDDHLAELQGFFLHLKIHRRGVIDIDHHALEHGLGISHHHAFDIVGPGRDIDDEILPILVGDPGAFHAVDIDHHIGTGKRVARNLRDLPADFTRRARMCQSRRDQQRAQQAPAKHESFAHIGPSIKKVVDENSANGYSKTGGSNRNSI